ncbi:MAG: ribosome recycling factor [Deltaproteobacteria bacterium]|jgi:ribosome recycling factor|nr:ribosome recycling factor [Deltaproteobacteria bacterium]
MLDDIFNDVEARMEKTLESLSRDFKKIRTGRATPAILDNLTVAYYGEKTPLNQMASIAAPEARLLVIQPWDASVIGEVEKVILKSDLGLTPQNDGKVIRIAVPPLSQERRKELSKLVKKNAEEAKVAVRSIRREANEQIKERKKNKDITEDEQRKAEANLQKLTATFTDKIDKSAEEKDKEITEL